MRTTKLLLHTLLWLVVFSSVVGIIAGIGTSCEQKYEEDHPPQTSGERSEQNTENMLFILFGTLTAVTTVAILTGLKAKSWLENHPKEYKYRPPLEVIPPKPTIGERRAKAEAKLNAIRELDEEMKEEMRVRFTQKMADINRKFDGS